jgi:hypothetical protein
MIRIGLLTSAREVRISSSGNYFLLEKTPEASRQPVRGEIQIRLEQDGFCLPDPGCIVRKA